MCSCCRVFSSCSRKKSELHVCWCLCECECWCLCECECLCLCECNAHVAPHHPRLQEAALFLWRGFLPVWLQERSPTQAEGRPWPGCSGENSSFQRLESPQRSEKKKKKRKRGFPGRLEASVDGCGKKRSQSRDLSSAVQPCFLFIHTHRRHLQTQHAV